MYKYKWILLNFFYRIKGFLYTTCDGAASTMSLTLNEACRSGDYGFMILVYDENLSYHIYKHFLYAK